MKRIIPSLALIAGASSILSCNDKLNIAAPYKNITVVYGLLDIADTAHYIRIQKAFMDENQSAIDMAKIADSNFYSALSVVMKEIGPSGNLISTIALNQVDLANEGYTKDTGAFFNTPNYAYKFKYTLNPSNQYRIVIKNTATGEVDSAISPVISDNGPISYFGVTEWQRTTETISFAKVLREDGKPDEITYGVNIPANVGAAELAIRFNWTDSNIVTGTASHKYADFSSFSSLTTIVPSATSSKSYSYSTQNKDIYDFLRNALGTPGANQYRYFDSCDMYLYVAGTEYQRYNELNANKGGLTANEIRPIYTNLRGLNVMGLFSTRAKTKRLQMPFGESTKDSLRSNTLTRDLNIRFY
jgi:hypothetical protein